MIFNPPDFEPIAVVYATIFGVVFGVLTLRILLHPLRITGNLVSLLAECAIATLCLVGIVSGMDEAFGKLSYLLVIVGFISSAGGVIILSPLILLTLALSWKQRPNAEPPNQEDTPDLIPLPQFSLSEVIGIVTSLCFSPIAVNAVSQQTSMATTFLATLIVFPPLFWRAISRLNANHVPVGLARIGFLCVYPYMVCGCLYFSTICFLILRPGANGSTKWIPDRSGFGLALCIIAVASGAVFAWIAKIAAPPKINPANKGLWYK